MTANDSGAGTTGIPASDTIEIPVRDGERGLIATTTTIPGAALTRGRLLWPDAAFTDFACLRCPADRLTLRDIDQRDPAPKLHMIGHLRFVKALSYGRDRPRILAWLRLSVDHPARQMFPGVSAETEAGETLLSANSLITYTLRELVARGWLHRRGGAWKTVVPGREETWRARGEAVVSWLEQEDRLHLYAGPWPASPDDGLEGVHPVEDVIPIDRLGYLRELVWHENPVAAFNTAFFLLEHNDFFSHHSALGEPYNLFVHDGEIRRPPLYPRSTLWQRMDGRWEAGLCGLADVTLLSGDEPALLRWVVDEEAAITAYTRRWAIPGQNRVVGFTPAVSGRHEYTIIDTRVVGYKRGGGLEIPQNGFVLSIAPEAHRSELAGALISARVRYRFASPALAGIRQAIQAGPRLLSHGEISLAADALAREAFWVDRTGAGGVREPGVAPTDYPLDVDRTRAGRLGVGIDRGGNLLVVALVGSETRGVRDARLDSAGATLVELAGFMAELGAVDAVNMDGGGSTQLFFLSGLATVPGGRLGLQSVHYERLIPSAGVVM